MTDNNSREVETWQWRALHSMVTDTLLHQEDGTRALLVKMMGGVPDMAGFYSAIVNGYLRVRSDVKPDGVLVYFVDVLTINGAWEPLLEAPAEHLGFTDIDELVGHEIAFAAEQILGRDDEAEDDDDAA